MIILEDNLAEIIHLLKIKQLRQCDIDNIQLSKDLISARAISKVEYYYLSSVKYIFDFSDVKFRNIANSIDTQLRIFSLNLSDVIKELSVFLIQLLNYCDDNALEIDALLRQIDELVANCIKHCKHKSSFLVIEYFEYRYFRVYGSTPGLLVLGNFLTFLYAAQRSECRKYLLDRSFGYYNGDVSSVYVRGEEIFIESTVCLDDLEEGVEFSMEIDKFFKLLDRYDNLTEQKAPVIIIEENHQSDIGYNVFTI